MAFKAILISGSAPMIRHIEGSHVKKLKCRQLASSPRCIPRTQSNCLARERPCICQLRESDFRLGMTKVRMGMGGRYLATRLAVLPEDAYATISLACKELQEQLKSRKTCHSLYGQRVACTI